MKPDVYRFNSRQELQQLVDAYGKDFFAYIPTQADEGLLIKPQDAETIQGSWSSRSIKNAKAQGWNVIPFK